MGYILLIAATFFGAFLQAGVGFGQATVMMIALPVLYNVNTSVALMSAVCFIQPAFMVMRYYRRIQWKQVLPFVGVALIWNFICAYYSAGWNQQVLKAFLGAVFILLALYFLGFQRELKIKGSVRNGILTGSIAGAMSGIFGVSGPPASLYLSAVIEDKLDYVVNMQFFFFSVSITTIISKLRAGVSYSGFYGVILVCWAVSVAGTVCGVRAFANVSKAQTLKIIYAVIGISGLITIIQALL